MIKSTVQRETEIQNKIALSIFYISTVLATFFFIEEVNLFQNQELIRYLYYLMTIFCNSGYLGFLVFVPTRYKSIKKNSFQHDFIQWEITDESLDRLFSFSADKVPSILLSIIFTVISVPIVKLINQFIGDMSFLPFVVFIIFLLIVSLPFSAIINYLISKILGLKLKSNDLLR